MADGVTVVAAGAEALDEVRPLWLALRDHAHATAPQLGPVRDDDDSWGRRRGQYERWIAEDDGAILLARDGDGRAVGYGFIREERGAGSPTWTAPASRLELETLSVLPAARGAGVGTALVAAVRAEARRRGVEAIDIAAVATNAGALRFYEREGFRPVWLVLRDAP